MGTLTVGLYVSRWVPPGSVYKILAGAFGVEPLADTEYAVAISELDWIRLPGADRERLVDEWTRRCAERGIDELRTWLLGEVERI